MYYPKHQIKVELVRNLGTVVDKQGNIVKALNVIVTGDGKIFEYNSLAKETGNFKGLKQFIEKNTEDLKINLVKNSSNVKKGTVLQISPEKIKDGKIKRYFLYNKALNTVEEIEESDVNTVKRELEPYEEVSSVEWTIEGFTNDQIIQGNRYPGIRTRNTKEIERIKKVIPIISRKLNDPLEYTQGKSDLEETETLKYRNKDKFYIPGPSKQL